MRPLYTLRRDIKCANVLINENKRYSLFLLDFGISMGEIICYNGGISAPQYMSPSMSFLAKIDPLANHAVL